MQNLLNRATLGLQIGGLLDFTSFVALLSLSLDKQAALPLFRQLYSALRTAILEGRLEGGTRLPPTRLLARELHISRNTIVNAFEQLIAEGYLEGKMGSGTYIAHVLPEEVLQVKVRVSTSPPGKEKKAEHISQWGMALMRQDVNYVRYAEEARAFQPGMPAIDQFPYKLWSKLAANCWRAPEPHLLSYGDAQGYFPLRATIASYLKATRGMQCEPEQVIITTGTQQALDLAARMIVDPGEIVVMEDPGYLGARVALAGTGATILPIAVDQDGLQVEQLKNQNVRVRLVYITPSHQYPVGVTMSLARRLALLEWAARTGAWILEDDYDSEYRYEGPPLAALQGLDLAGRVLYLGTFSKVILPALRLGYLVVPPALVETFARGRATIDRQAPTLDQVILAEFIREGHFVRHIRRMKGVYMERQATLIDAARHRLAGLLDIQPASAGLHVMGWLQPGADDLCAHHLARSKGVDSSPFSAYAITPQPRGGLVLGYACANPSAIRAGVDHLAAALAVL